MPRFVVVSREHHGKKKWKRVTGYGYAVHETYPPIVLDELARTLRSMPLGFVQHDGRFRLVAILSLGPRNMFVGANGQWLSEYVPASLRAYPFALVPRPDSEEMVLCFDEESGLVSDGPDGEGFFDEEGSPTPATSTVLNFSLNLKRSQTNTDLAVSALSQAGVLAPWVIELKSELGTQKIESFYRVDEQALAALPDDSVSKLRATGALPLAYGQLFSMGQLSVFEQLAKYHAQSAPKPIAPLPDTLDKLFDQTEHLELKFD